MEQASNLFNLHELTIGDTCASNKWQQVMVMATSDDSLIVGSTPSHSRDNQIPHSKPRANSAVIKAGYILL